MPWNALWEALSARVDSHGIRMTHAPLGWETPAEFDGPSIVVDPEINAEERSFYLVHSLGSIVAWSLDPGGSQRVFDELEAAKKRMRETVSVIAPEQDGSATVSEAHAGFASALAGWWDFEQRSSEHAVWVLEDVGHAWAVPPYTCFFRADMEVMARHHQTGLAPVWSDFYRQWKEEVAQGKRLLTPFTPRPVPPFTPVPLPRKRVIQEADGKAS